MSATSQRLWLRLMAMAGASAALAQSPASAPAMAEGLFAAGATAAALTFTTRDSGARRWTAGLGAAALLGVLAVVASRESLGTTRRAGYALWLALAHLAFALGPRAVPPTSSP